jgi:hypothetical protein
MAGSSDAAGKSEYDNSPEAKRLLDAVKQELADRNALPDGSAYKKYAGQTETVDPALVHWLVSKLKGASVR